MIKTHRQKFFVFTTVLFCQKVILALPSLRNFDIWSEEGVNNENHEELLDGTQNFTSHDQQLTKRGPKVLNFFPVPVEEECLSTDRRRKGICMNAYECKIQGGNHHGPCALGFGVCCVFTATCFEEAHNNITYFVNPDFPDLTNDMTNCSLTVKKIDPEISQLRLDFIHFNLGQPNRKTGVCDDDVFVISGGNTKDLKICGSNSGQHVYFEVENADEPISISMTLSKKIVSRLWEVRIIQVPFMERAPAGCLQYHTGGKGVVQTMNFADNGRHLAEQDYNICMRQEEGMCTIVYEPCDENSFKIGPNNGGGDDPFGSSSVMGNDPQMVMGDGGTQIQTQTQTQAPTQTQSDQNGEDTQIQDDPQQEVGSGDGGAMVESRAMDTCSDRIIMPCDSEDLILPIEYGPGYCTMSRCGDSFCPKGVTPCKYESSVTPFAIGVRFGPNSRESPPDENLGMCLRYEQLPCAV